MSHFKFNYSYYHSSYLTIAFSAYFFWALNLSFALPIDEKLALRILKLSESKKTALINRGIEDGLEKGDHAKFYISSGVVARGELIKISPARSVWALYRLVRAEEVEENKMINLKITPKYQITPDPTKAFTTNDPVYLKGQNQNIGTQNHENQVNDQESETGNIDKKELPVGAGPQSTEFVDSDARTWEIWGAMHLSFLNSTNSTGAEDTGTAGSNKVLDLTFALEKYFATPDRWYSDFSFYPFIHYYSQESITVQGNSVGGQSMTYGLGLNYHFLASPLSYDQLIGHVGISFGVGNAEDRSALVDNANNQQAVAMEGSANLLTVGVGLKYNLRWGAGFKLIVDYYRQGETYEVDEVTDPQTKIIQGPRVQLGLLYRF